MKQRGLALNNLKALQLLLVTVTVFLFLNEQVT